MRLSRSAAALIAADLVACGPSVRTGLAPCEALAPNTPGTSANGRSLTDAERGFLSLTKTQKGREILLQYFQLEYLEYLSGNPDAYARFNPVRVADGAGAVACDNLDRQHKKCKNACLAAFGACETGAAAGCTAAGPGWPECWAIYSSTACIPAILICLNHCSNLDDQRREQCRGGKGT